MQQGSRAGNTVLIGSIMQHTIHMHRAWPTSSVSTVIQKAHIWWV